MILDRLFAALLFTAGLATSASAQSLGESYAQTQAIFGSTPAHVVNDLEGKWLPLSQLAGGIAAPSDAGMIESFMERFCEKAPMSLSVETRGETSLAITTTKPSGSLTESYDWTDGSQFAYTVDAEAFMSFLGMADAGAEQRAAAIAARPQRVAIYRPASDLLVLAPDQGEATILGRCP